MENPIHELVSAINGVSSLGTDNFTFMVATGLIVIGLLAAFVSRA